MDFIVLSSSRGTTFQAVIDRMRDGSLGARCLGLVTDRADRACLDKARAAGLPSRVVERNEGEEREAYAVRLAGAAEELGALHGKTVVAALGWMWILPEAFVRQFPVINVHPALLPRHGGRGMYGSRVHESVLAAKDSESGITIHLMDAGVDTGETLLQKTCPVLPGDTPAALQARVQELEKEWYPKMLEMVRTGDIALPFGEK